MVHKGVYEFRVNSNIVRLMAHFFSYYALNVSDSIKLYIYIYIYIKIKERVISRQILTVKAAGLNPHSGSHWKRLSRRWRRRFVSLNYRVTHLLGLLNISITFSNAHLVLLCYIFRFSSGFKHVKMSRTPQQGQFFLLHVWGTSQQLHSVEHITSLLRTAYFHYFDCKIGDQDESWAPHICCKPCYNGLTA